jgi:hypothetical protein
MDDNLRLPAYPILRSAEFIAFSERGRLSDLIDGRTSSPFSESDQISLIIFKACFDSGTSWGRCIFIRSAGIRQIA